MSRDDPMGRARAALDNARRARGAEDDDAIEIPPVDPRNPMVSAEAALARARQVQEGAKGGRITAREADAALQLRYLKRQGAGGALGADAPEADEAPADAEPDAPPRPRKRRL